ncbi:unnamed protein product [Rhizophagus irregularis]|nr:unnamed protein product [Rhizophagus irregularis]
MSLSVEPTENNRRPSTDKDRRNRWSYFSNRDDTIFKLSDNENDIILSKKERYQIAICQDGKFAVTFDTANLWIKVLENTDHRQFRLSKEKTTSAQHNSNNQNDDKEEITKTIARFKINENLEIDKFDKGDKSLIRETNSSANNSNDADNMYRWSLDISNVQNYQDKYFIFVAVSHIDVNEDMKGKDTKSDYKKNIIKRRFPNSDVRIALPGSYSNKSNENKKGTAIYRLKLNKDNNNNFDFKEISPVTYCYSDSVSGICKFIQNLDDIDQNDYTFKRFIVLNFNGIYNFEYNFEYRSFDLKTRFDYPKSIENELKHWHKENLEEDCMNKLLTCLYNQYFLVEHYKNNVQMLEVYDLADMSLKTTPKRVERKDKRIRNFNYNTFSVSKLQICFTRGLNSIKLYFMENGLEVVSKKFDEFEKIYSLEFIDSDEKLLIIGGKKSQVKLVIWDIYNTVKAETITLENFSIVELSNRLARTSGNILQVDEEGRVTSVLKKIDKLKQNTSEEEKENFKKYTNKKDGNHTIHYDKEFDPIVIDKEPWVIDEALEHLNKRRRFLVTNYIKIHQYEEMTIYIQHIVWRHIPRSVSWPGKNFIKDDDLEDNEMPESDMELAIYRFKGRELKDTVVVAYFLEYYSSHATDYAGWMSTVSKALPLLFKYNYDDYARKLFRKECFANQDYFSAQDPYDIIPVEYQAKRNHNIKFRAFRIDKLQSDEYECVESVDVGLMVGISFSIFFLWIEFVLYLRLVSKIAIYIYFVIYIIKNIFPFILFMFIVIMGFAHTMFILLKNPNDPKIKVKSDTLSGTAKNINNETLFDITLESKYDVVDKNDNPFSSFSAAIIAAYFCIFIVTVLQNMLIAFMGGVYERAETKGRQALLRFRANQIADYEALEHFHFWPPEPEPKYIYYIGQSKNFQEWYQKRKDDQGEIYKDFEEKPTNIITQAFKDVDYDETSIWQFDDDNSSDTKSKKREGSTDYTIELPEIKEETILSNSLENWQEIFLEKMNETSNGKFDDDNSSNTKSENMEGSTDSTITLPKIEEETIKSNSLENSQEIFLEKINEKINEMKKINDEMKKVNDDIQNLFNEMYTKFNNKPQNL